MSLQRRHHAAAQGLSEYVLLVAAIALGLLSVVAVLGDSLDLALAHASARLRFAPTLSLGPSIPPPPARWGGRGAAPSTRAGALVETGSLLDGEPIGSATLSWSPPTTNVDGSPANDLAGYRIYYGTESGRYGPPVDIGLVTEHTIHSLEIGRTYYFAISTFDARGNESALSNEVAKTIHPPGA